MNGDPRLVQAVVSLATNVVLLLLSPLLQMLNGL